MVAVGDSIDDVTSYTRILAAKFILLLEHPEQLPELIVEMQTFCCQSQSAYLLTQRALAALVASESIPAEGNANPISMTLQAITTPLTLSALVASETVPTEGDPNSMAHSILMLECASFSARCHKWYNSSKPIDNPNLRRTICAPSCLAGSRGARSAGTGLERAYLGRTSIRPRVSERAWRVCLTLMILLFTYPTNTPF
jgi:hypothetical protein